jgi:hypothetical protein
MNWRPRTESSLQADARRLIGAAQRRLHEPQHEIPLVQGRPRRSGPGPPASHDEPERNATGCKLIKQAPALLFEENVWSESRDDYLQSDLAAKTADPDAPSQNPAGSPRRGFPLTAKWRVRAARLAGTMRAAFAPLSRSTALR